MAGNREAMDDLKRILDSRAQFYSKADQTVDTTDMSADLAFGHLQQLVGH